MYHIDLDQPHIDIDQLQSRREWGKPFSWKLVRLGWLLFKKFKNLLNRQEHYFLSTLYVHFK